MEQQLYNTALLFAAVLNVMMAVTLVHNNLLYRDYDVYCRSRLLSALVFLAFAAGFLLHWQFQWRVSWPAAASALSVGYFHVGAVLFGWSHTSLLCPDYLTRRIVVRDLLILALGIASYILALLHPLEFNLQYSIFFLHAAYIAATFYRTYYRVRRSLAASTVEGGFAAHSWWTAQTKHDVLVRHHSFAISGHLIIVFGVCSIVVTALLPTAVWPYTLLLALGVAVFGYIFYSLEVYGSIIEAATSATENIR